MYANKTLFRSAITDSDGDVDAGYLAMFILMVLVCGAIPLMCIGAFVAMYFEEHHHFDASGLGVGIGAVCGGFAATVGAVGVFRAGDKPHPPIVVATGQNATATASTPDQPASASASAQ